MKNWEDIKRNIITIEIYILRFNLDNKYFYIKTKKN